LTISGAGVTTLGGSNSYTGQTYLNGAAIISNNANLGAVATGAQINMNGGTLETSGSFSLDAAGSDKRPIVLGNNGGTFNVGAGGDLTVSGVISGGIVGVTTALTKTGAGALTLTAANTYAGNTYIKAGSLFVSGSLSGSAEVIVGDSANLSTAAILSGTGTVGSVILGAAASNTGAEVEPSGGVTESSAGATLHTGNFTVGAGSGATLALQIGRTTAGGSLSGDSSDHISVNGSVSLDGNLQLTLQSSYTPQVNDILYLIIHGSGTSTTGDFATVNGVALSGNTFTFDNLTWQLTETASASGNSFTGGDDVAIEAVAAIPEPSTWASILAGFGILVLLQNNRRRRI
jgi:autotransporter-associated beta strand protein